MAYVHLHVHSQYSILNSTASIADLAQMAKTCGMHALALTDFCNMHGAVEFYKACVDAEIKPIIGIEIIVASGSRFEKKKTLDGSAGHSIVLLAKNKKGYQNLCKLSSFGYLEGFYYTPRIDKELLERYCEGLICLSGSIQTRIGHLIKFDAEDELEQEIRSHLTLFGEDFYFELQNHSMSEELQEQWLRNAYLEYAQLQEKINQKLISLSKEKGIPCALTNDVRYLVREDWKAHEILLNIQSGEPCEIWENDALGRPKAKILNPKRKVLPSHELYFKTQEEMQALFAEFPDAASQTEKIAAKCALELDFSKKYYPVFIPPALEGKTFDDKMRAREAENYLKTLCEEGIPQRYTAERLAKIREKYPDGDPEEIVRKRVKDELKIITSKGMCDYLLIVHDVIRWAKQRKIPVSPGRGSGAGSIILFLIGITDIEPLRFNLFFERFINPERPSYPDIDVDICMDRRMEVIEYAIEKYGKEKVAQIITFGTMKAKMAVKDVGRVLSVPLSKVNQIAKLVPEEINITLTRALEVDQELKQLYETDEEVRQIVDLGKRVEGSIRNTGIHAAGLIICGDALMEHIPVCTAKDADMIVTQFSMKPVESVGMLKMDFLGLKTLTCVQKTVDAIKTSENVEIDWVNLPLEDAKTFSLLNQGKTHGVFQLESSGMQELAKQVHIDKFEEIIAVGALYRPGPMEMIPTFINRKHGREEIEFDHEHMKDILEETYGVMVYQEQVMQIASRLAGYSLGEGDLLRKAMGKKDKEEMTRQRKKFLAGAKKLGIEEQIARAIFDKTEKFASYGFNKSHAAAYGYLIYVTAYLKAHYPKQWLASLMTCDMDDISKVAKHIRESKSMGIDVLPPDINESGSCFISTEKGIRFAMNGIKGVGRGIVEAIVEERNAQGSFESLYDFVRKLGKKVGKKTIEVLIDAGCFDFTNWARSALVSNLDEIYDKALKELKERDRGFLDLFAGFDEEKPSMIEPLKSPEGVSKEHILAREKELLGFYLTGNPLDEHQTTLNQLSCLPLHQIHEQEPGSVLICGCVIEEVVLKISKIGRKFAIITISDGSDRFELPIWTELYEKHTELLKENKLICAVLQVDKKDDQIKLHCRGVHDLTKLDDEEKKSLMHAFDKAKVVASNKKNAVSQPKPERRRLTLNVDIHKMRLSHVIAVKELFQAFPGQDEIVMDFFDREKKVGTLLIEEHWGIKQDANLEKKLNQFQWYIKHNFDIIA